MIGGDILLYYICLNPYMVDVVFDGCLSDCMSYADTLLSYNQCDVVIYASDNHSYPVAYRPFYGVAPDDDVLSRDIVSFGAFGYYDEWFNFDDIRDSLSIDNLC